MRWRPWLICAVGRWDNAFIILDEAQNTTPAQMKMFLTRIGFGSKVIITGDSTQKDLPPGTVSGLDVAEKDAEQGGRYRLLLSHQQGRGAVIRWYRRSSRLTRIMSTGNSIRRNGTNGGSAKVTVTEKEKGGNSSDHPCRDRGDRSGTGF